MTNHNDVEPLQQHYELRKRRHKAPRSIRELVISKARNNQQHVWQRFNLLNWTVGVSALSALLLLYQFVTIYLEPNHVAPTQYQVIQIHRLHQESSPTLNDIDRLQQQMTVLHADNYARYLQTHHILTSHHSQIAKLLDTNGGWELQTCDDQIVQITPQLVNAMWNAQLFDKSIQQGQLVNIQFDQQGRITSIHAAQTPYSC